MKKRFTRRDLLKTTGVSVAAVATTSLLAPAARAQAPKRGGRLRLAMQEAGTTDNLDPATFITHFIWVAVANGVHNHLVEIDENNQAVPELAKHWEASKGADVWTFELRDGVEFHNGKTLEAEDVVASINHHRGEERKSGAKELVNQIEEVKADGKRTVVCKLSGPNADFAFLMSDYHICIGPAKDGKLDWEPGVGTGGYRIVEFEPGVRILLERNPNYWKEGRAHFDEVEVLAIPDTTARQTALVTGEVDVIERTDLRTAHLLPGQNASVRMEEGTGVQHETMPMDFRKPPFNDRNVRLALKHAINRQELVDKLLRGHGTVANDHPITPAHRYYAGDIAKNAYDPDKAKHYLKQAGLSSLAVDLHSSEAAFPSAIDAAVLFKESAALASIDIKVIREPNDGYWSNVWMKKPFFFSHWSGRPTEDWMFSVAYAGGADWNESYWRNERFDQLLVEARGTLDEGKRREMYREMQEILRDDGASIIPLYPNFVDARHERVRHADKVGTLFNLDNRMILERWWMA